MRLVSISGPPASGKTTLARALAKRLSCDLVEDQPRRALGRIDPTTVARDPASFQHYVGYAALVAERMPSSSEGGDAAQTTEVRVCDKSLIDAVAYWDVLVQQDRPGWAVELSRQEYDLVVICDYRGITKPPDALQTAHWHLREALAARIRAVASETGSRLLTVSGSPSARLEQTLRGLEQGGASPVP